MIPPVAAIVVSCNSAAEIGDCLASLGGVAEVVVVDNASADDTRQVVSRGHPQVRVIANRENRGFAAAANQGVSATTCPLVLFLNPDAVLTTDLAPLAAALEAPGVGAAGGRLVDSEGRTQIGFTVRAFPTAWSLVSEALLLNRLWPRNPVNRRYRCLDLDHEQAQDVDQPAGAFLLARREALEAVGGWDERFFPLWFEDVDLCRRWRQAGYRIRYVPDCRARHRGAHSLAAISVVQKQIYWYRNLLRYSDKHFSIPLRLMVRASVALGAVLRFVASLGSRRIGNAYGKVLGLALGRQAAEERVQPHVLT